MSSQPSISTFLQPEAKRPCPESQEERQEPSSNVPGAADLSRSLENGAVQPILLSYPKDGNNRVFLPDWFKSRAWLEYLQKEDKVYCFYCRLFFSGSGEKAFVQDGYCSWNKALERMKLLVNSSGHLFAAERSAAFLATKKQGSVASQLNDAHVTFVAENRQYLKSIVDVVMVCARQGIALRGHRESEDKLNRGNFLALLDLVAKYDPTVASRLTFGQKNAKYTHWSIQNDLIPAIACLVRHDMTKAVAEAGTYTIICDESKDIANEEQMSVCLRYLDCKIGETVEVFLGFIACTDGQNATALKEKIMYMLTVNSIDMQSCSGQCYDGASVISGRFSGVQIIMRDVMPTAIYVHCFAHRLNLVVVDVVKASARMGDLLHTLQALHRFMRISAVHTIFKVKQEELYPGHQTRELPAVSDTRWVCQHRICEAVLLTLKAVIDTVDDVTVADQGERAVSARNIQSSLHSSFVVHLIIMEWVLRICGDATITFQSESQNLQTGLDQVALMKTLLERPSLPAPDNIWDKLWSRAEELISDLYLPELRERRVRRARQDFAEVMDKRCHSKDDYRTQVFVPVCEKVFSELHSRFLVEENSVIYSGVASLSPKNANFLDTTKISAFCHHYHIVDSADCPTIRIEVAMMKQIFERKGAEDLPETLLDLTKFAFEHVLVFAILSNALKIAVTLPISSASAERSFSAMKRIKSWLRASMGNERLSDLAVINVIMEITENVKPDDVIDEFAARGNRRLALV